MQTLSLKQVPNQTLSSILNLQQVSLNIYTLIDGKLYMDVNLNDAPIAAGVICQNNRFIVRNAASGFNGDFVFTDTQGYTDPVFSGFGSRYLLIYLTSAEIAVL